MKKIFNHFLMFMIVVKSSFAFAESDCAKYGALVLAHGSHKGGHHQILSSTKNDDDHNNHNDHTMSDPWNETVTAAVAEAKSKVQFPIELAFGMWDRKSFQVGVDRLVEQGVCELRIVPLFISSDSEMIDIQKYMFGLRESPAFPFTVEPLKIPPQIQKINYLKALDTHEFVSEILMERVKNISFQPQYEGLILIAHGPYTDYYEPRWIELLKVHGERIQSELINKNGMGFKDISFYTLRDDSNDSIRNNRTQQIRNKVNQLNDTQLRPLVVPVILTAGGIESGIFQRLNGLSYEMTDKYLMPHQRMVDWIVQTATR